MTRFYFDIVDDDGLSIDAEGVECDDLDAAITLARQTISDMARDVFRDPDQSELAIRIRDHDSGPVVLKVTLDMSGLQ